MNMFDSVLGVFNGRSGKGGSGDFSGGHFKPRMRIPAVTIEAILRQVPGVRTACEIIGEDIARAWRKFPEEQSEWTEIEEELNFKHTIEKAMYWSEAFGGALIIPRYKSNVVDLNMMSKEFKAPPENSLIGWRVFMPHQLRAHYTDNDVFQEMLGDELPEYYKITQKHKRKNNNDVEIHHSWTIPMFGPLKSEGVKFSSSDQSCEILFGDSRVDMVYDDMLKLLGSLQSCSHLLDKINIDTLKVEGLADAIQGCSNTNEINQEVAKVLQRLNASVQGASVYNPVVLDQTEDLQRNGLSGGSGACVQITQLLIDQFVSSTRIPKTKLRGEQSKGLNNGGESDLANYYDRVSALRERRVTPVLNRMDSLVSSDRGINISDWNYCSLYEPTEKEKAEIDKMNSERDRNYSQIGLPYVDSKIMEKLHNNGVYSFTPDEIDGIRISEGTFNEVGGAPDLE